MESWPCVLTQEGRSDELVRIARISELRDLGKDIRLTVDRFPSQTPILNDHLWRIHEELDIEQWEFSRNHWAVKEQDLFLVLRAAGHEVDTSAIGRFEAKPLPAPARLALVEAKNSISNWSHSAIDDFLLEANVKGLSAGRDEGSRRERTNAIFEFAIGHRARSNFNNVLMAVGPVTLITLSTPRLTYKDGK